MFERYVAIGDSTTEGLDDPDGRGGYRGWANRFAEHVARAQGGLLRYANLAVRGLTARQIREGQLQRATQLRPDLSTAVAGMNDLLRPRFDAAAIERDMELMFGALAAAGATVLTFTLPDLSAVMPLARPLGGRRKALNAAIRAAAARTGAKVVELDLHPVAADPRLWSSDRLHANSLGHERIAAALAEAVGLPGADSSWTEPLPDAPPRRVFELASAELAWARQHFFPWVWRHARGRSSGDGRRAKRPELMSVELEPTERESRSTHG